MAIKFNEYVKIADPELLIKEGDIVRIIHSFDYPGMKDNEISKYFKLPPRHVDRIGELALVTRIMKNSGYELCYLKDCNWNAWWPFESVEFVRSAKFEEVVTLRGIAEHTCKRQRIEIEEIAKWDLLEERAKCNFLSKRNDYIVTQIEDLKRAMLLYEKAGYKKVDEESQHVALIRIYNILNNYGMKEDERINAAIVCAKTALERYKTH